MNKAIWALVAVVIIGVGAYLYMSQNPAPIAESIDTETPSSAMRAEENMIVVMEQKPENSVVVSQVHLAAPGFVVIHEDNNDSPAAMVGSSALLQAGDTSQVTIKLSKAMLDGTKLHAMLHTDTNGDGKFDEGVDMPVQSKLGGPIEGWFEVTANASENAPISI